MGKFASCLSCPVLDSAYFRDGFTGNGRVSCTAIGHIYTVLLMSAVGLSSSPAANSALGSLFGCTRGMKREASKTNAGRAAASDEVVKLASQPQVPVIFVPTPVPL